MSEHINGRAATPPPATGGPADDVDAAEDAIQALYGGRTDLRRVARDLGLSLVDLAAWARAPAGAAAIASLRRLADHRAALALSRARTDAAKALLRLARDRDAKETARKACVDLLRLTPDEPAPTSPPPTGFADEELTPEEADAWREALEHIGRRTETDQAPAETQPS